MATSAPKTTARPPKRRTVREVAAKVVSAVRERGTQEKCFVCEVEVPKADATEILGKTFCPTHGNDALFMSVNLAGGLEKMGVSLAQIEEARNVIEDGFRFAQSVTKMNSGMNARKKMGRTGTAR